MKLRSGKRKASKDYNPRLRKQVVPNRAGFLFPGHDFLGPLNPVDFAVPRNEADVQAKDHDMEYTDIGPEAYYKFTPGDAKLIERLKDNPTLGARVASWVFKAKRMVAPKYITPEQPVKQETVKISPDITGKKRSFQEWAGDFAGNTQSVRNIRPRTQALQTQSVRMDGSGSGNEKGLNETPVDQVINVQRGPPEYTFSTLPYIRQNKVFTTKFMDEIGFRMTSPYDCLVGYDTVDSNTGAGDMEVDASKTDAADTIATSARWFDFYAGMYKYYHVVSARWWLTIENNGDTPLWVHQWYSNETQRPKLASNMDMQLWNDCHSHYLECQHVAIASGGQNQTTQTATGDNDKTTTVTSASNFQTGNNITKKGAKPAILTLSGEYSPGDYAREIRLDSAVENWTLTTTNPKLAERLVFRVRPLKNTIKENSADSAEDAISYSYQFKVEYLVEFKELAQSLRYPVNSQPLTVNIVSSNTD